MITLIQDYAKKYMTIIFKKYFSINREAQLVDIL